MKNAVPALLELKLYEGSKMCHLSIKAFPKNPGYFQDPDP